MSIKQLTILVCLTFVISGQISAMGTIKNLFSKKTGILVRKSVSHPLGGFFGAVEQHQRDHLTKNQNNHVPLTGIPGVLALKNEQKHTIKKSALWGFSAFNGLLYTVGFAMNQEMLHPLFENTAGLVAASACFTVAATYNAKQYLNRKRFVDLSIKKMGDHIKVV